MLLLIQAGRDPSEGRKMGDNNENNNGNDTERRSFFGGINGRWGSLIILVLLMTPEIKVLIVSPTKNTIGCHSV